MEQLISSVADLAQDQGIANVISLALIWIIFNMQRAQGAETKQQNKLITQLGLTISKIGDISGSVDSLASKVEIDSQQRSKVVTDGISKIAANTVAIQANTTSTNKAVESVEEMKTKLDSLEKQMEAMKTMIAEIKQSMTKADTDHQQLDNKLDGIMSNIADVLEEIAKLKERSETPTQPIDLETSKPKPETPTIEAPVVPKPDAPKKDVSL
jgi:chromosome segregation ATPase